MPNNDYYVIVYKILKYLYSQLKSGKRKLKCKDLPKQIDISKIDINYWEYILENIYNEGLVTGTVEECNFIDEDEPSVTLETIEITPKGIEYLQESSMMKKVTRALTSATNIVGNLA